ncbi:MAG: RidA family protein [Chitinophagaceae bacterium]
MEFIYTDPAKKPKGHYSPAVIHNGMIYVSGQLPLDEQGEAHTGSIEEQTTLCMKNIATILQACHSDLHQIVKTNVYIADIALWARFNETYAAIMGDHRPARVVVPCGTLNRGCAIEIDCIAVVKS